MRDDLKAIWDQMRSDFQAVMLAFTTQRQSITTMGKSMDAMARAVDEVRTAVSEVQKTTEQQGEALLSIQGGMDRLMEVVNRYYEDHEQRISALEQRAS